MANWAEIDIKVDSSVKNKISAKKLINGYFMDKGYNDFDFHLSVKSTRLEGVMNVTFLRLVYCEPNEEFFKDLFNLQRILLNDGVYTLFNITATF